MRFMSLQSRVSVSEKNRNNVFVYSFVPENQHRSLTQGVCCCSTKYVYLYCNLQEKQLRETG